MNNQKDVTMRDIAREVGVSVSTVSKALRDDPSLPESRCRGIQQTARRLGYRPNPLVATLMAQLHHHRRRDDPHQIAWLDLWEGDPVGFTTFNVGPSLEGARERAIELGYHIEVYRPAVEHITFAHLTRVLATRGHWGIIVPPVPDRHQKLPLDMKRLAAVTIGTSLKSPIIHRVSPNHFQAGLLAFKKMRGMGFRRVGMLLTASMNARVGGTWLGAFLSANAGLPPAEQTTPLILGLKTSGTVASWVARERPDAVLLADSTLADEWLHQTRRGVRSIGWLIRPPGRNAYSGVDYDPEHLGRLAVDVVVGQIHRNERGSPTIPHTTVIDASWRDRNTSTASTKRCS